MDSDTEGRVRAFWEQAFSGRDRDLIDAMSDEGASGVARSYPPAKLARLSMLKTAYDPDNVFRLNQDIRPRAPR